AFFPRAAFTPPLTLPFVSPTGHLDRILGYGPGHLSI
ncbi:MAG: hypothetical protein ACI9C2_002091, partial [Gammaproteobacteria bacterium]